MTKNPGSAALGSENENPFMIRDLDSLSFWSWELAWGPPEWIYISI